MVVVMVTVGFGDISPVNKLETLVCIFLMLFGCGLFAYSMNEIGIILEKIDQEKEELRKDLNAISKWM